LNLLSDYGLIGFALLAIALTCFYGHAYGLTRAELTTEERSFAVGAATAVTALLAHSLLDFNLHIFSTAAVFMILVGFVVAMQESPETQDRVPMGPGLRYALGLGLLVFCGLAGWLIGRSALAYQYKSQADHYRTKLYWPEAQATYQKAIRLEPTNPWLYAGLGDVALNQSHWRVNPSLREERLALAREAIAWYEKALKLNPYFVEVLLKTARAYEILDDKEQVVSVCERAAKLDPQGPAAPLFLARFYFNQNDLPKAEKAALKAFELNWGYWNPTPGELLQEIRARQKAPQ
jgi:tetratricopeptide (TPR) repeat protein